ncbi:hypothetical protein [Mesorhizobium carmichaelinearum]|uniref:hypothetical protein n=1 Tax=Mesorhizobium carmichaelinearum TaxID=1208188 RepID=UPI0015CBD1BC|nr:hypothetical protein [Mesorhizobium carmichaelinearum]
MEDHEIIPGSFALLPGHQNSCRNRIPRLDPLQAPTRKVRPNRGGAFLVGDRNGFAGLHAGRLSRCGCEENRLSYQSRENGDLKQHGGEGDLFEHPRQRAGGYRVPAGDFFFGAD